MNIAKAAVAVSVLYAMSVGVSIVLTYEGIVLFGMKAVSVILFSIVVFAAACAVLAVILAIAYAIIKKPVVENGSYEIDRIKGKGE